ncbi:MAG: SEC59/DGK1/VTE5 family protein [Ignavibacteria bacterium]|nr:SEC59/DGK1/VTE5 family protein [Ignavibacteria bacterium]
MHNKPELKYELYRKSIHLSSSVIPFTYFFIERETEIILLSVMFVTALAIDVARINSDSFRSFYDKILGKILRHHESHKGGNSFTGGTYIVLAFLMCAILFPKQVAIASMLIVVFADSMAAITGMRFGRVKIGNGKTLEGSAAFVASGLAIVLLMSELTAEGMNIIAGVASVLVTSIAELIPLKIDDNIVIPMVFGFSYLIISKFIIG